MFRKELSYYFSTPIAYIVIGLFLLAVSLFLWVIPGQWNVIESGYQEMQVDNGDVYYVIALPKDIDFTSMVSIRVYDMLRNIWTDTSLDMTNNTETIAALCDEVGIDISHIDTSVYTIWALEDVPTGSKLRFIINE